MSYVHIMSHTFHRVHHMLLGRCTADNHTDRLMSPVLI